MNSTARLPLVSTLWILYAVTAFAEPRFCQLTPPAGPQGVVQQAARQVPITVEADVAVAGGGIGGVAAALAAAENGHSVVLVEERNCLGHEITTSWSLRAAKGRPALATGSGAKILEEFRRRKAIGPDGSINPALAKEILHRLVAQQPAIRVFFFSLPVGTVLADDGRAVGLTVVNRAGRQAFAAKTIVDATEEGQLTAGIDGPSAPSADSQSLSFQRLLRVEPTPELSTPPTEIRDALTVRGPYLVLSHLQPLSKSYAEAWTAAQMTTLEQAAALRRALDAQGNRPKKFFVSPETVRQSRTAPAIGACACKTLIAVRPAAEDLEAVLAAGGAAGKKAAKQAAEIKSGLLGSKAAPIPAASGLQVRELLRGPEAGVEYRYLEQKPTSIPIVADVDVLVVGGGTSGAPAAIAAARRNVRVALVEVLPNLGGTSSNRVTSYYWGVPWKSALSEEIDEPIQTHRATGSTGLSKVRFSGEEKKVVLEQLARKAHLQVFYRTFAAGALVEGGCLRGAIIENACGRQAILARVAIDATGHGDLAAAAGAEFDIGRTVDGFLHEAEHGPLRDALDPEDISKFYLRSPQAALSLNIRESRRIRGDATVTFGDVLADRRFPDVITRWRSNYDTHFPHSANQDDRAQDWSAVLGLFRKTLWGSIPYRAILPRGLENLLVVGKAYSATHDALIGGRMQRDLQHLGEAAGIAAALACQEKISPRAVSVDRLQAELVRAGVLLPEELSEAKIAVGAAPRIDLAATTARLGTPAAHDAMIELYRAGPCAAAHLLPLLQSEDVARRTEAALVLGMLGRREAAATLMERLVARDSRRFTFQLPDASGIPSLPVAHSAVLLLGRLRVPEAAEPIRQLLAEKDCPPQAASLAIVALERIGDKRAIDTIRPYLQAAKPLALAEENVQFESQWGLRTNAARALARLGDDSGIPMLTELLAAEQSLLRHYAWRLLRDLTQQDLPQDRSAWESWWKDHKRTSNNQEPAR